jgi:hypothetical protein
MTRVRIVLGTVTLAAGLAAAGSAPATAGPAAVPSFAGPTAFAPSPPAVICTPSWGSIVLPFCV